MDFLLEIFIVGAGGDAFFFFLLCCLRGMPGFLGASLMLAQVFCILPLIFNKLPYLSKKKKKIQHNNERIGIP